MSNQSCKLHNTFFLTSLFKRRAQAMGFTPVKPFCHTSSTKDCWRAESYRSIALLRRMLARPLFFWQKVYCTSEPLSPAVCTFNSRACCGFFCHWSHDSFHCCQNVMPTVKWLNQCERTCGHGNSGSVSQCGRRRGGGT